MSKNKITFTDRILEKTFLPFIPRWVSPNNVTTFRLLTVPFIAWLLFTGAYFWGGILFIISAFTDALDGAMARTRKQITDWGKLYDPIADKLLIGVVAIILVTRFINVWLAGVIVVLESIIVFVGIRQKYILKLEVEALWPGKVKMILQSVGIALLIFSLVLSLPLLADIAALVLYVSVIFAIVSLVVYKSI